MKIPATPSNPSIPYVKRTSKSLIISNLGVEKTHDLIQMCETHLPGTFRFARLFCLPGLSFPHGGAHDSPMESDDESKIHEETHVKSMGKNIQKTHMNTEGTQPEIENFMNKKMDMLDVNK